MLITPMPMPIIIPSSGGGGGDVAGLNLILIILGCLYFFQVAIAMFRLVEENFETRGELVYALIPFVEFILFMVGLIMALEPKKEKEPEYVSSTFKSILTNIECPECGVKNISAWHNRFSCGKCKYYVYYGNMCWPEEGTT